MKVHFKTHRLKQEIEGFIAALHATDLDLYKEVEYERGALHLTLQMGRNRECSLFTFILGESKAKILFNYSTERKDFTCSEIRDSDRLAMTVCKLKTILSVQHLPELKEALDNHLLSLVDINLLDKEVIEKLTLLNNN